MQINMNLIDLLKKSSSNIVDVRTEEEFLKRNLKGSINIPLDEIPAKINELAKMQPVVLCCAAGVRSEHAVQFLIKNGLNEVYNGGSWSNIQNILES